LLDEPTASLDPEVAAFIREFLHNERKQFQVSIIITSHNMAEVEELCDRVIFINHGKLIANDTPENLAKTIEISHLRLMVAQENILKLIELCGKANLKHEQSGLYVMIDIKEREIPNFLRTLGEHKIEYEEISIERPSLEDYFLVKARNK
jgi:ABC-2 type transport system ATP-binding protein